MIWCDDLTAGRSFFVLFLPTCGCLDSTSHTDEYGVLRPILRCWIFFGKSSATRHTALFSYGYLMTGYTILYPLYDSVKRSG